MRARQPGVGIDTLREGVRMIHSQLRGSFADLGVEEIDARGVNSIVLFDDEQGRPVYVRVGKNGDGQSSFPALVVTAVDQATNTLTVEADITTSFTLAGSAVQIIDQCEVGAPRKTAPVAPDVGWLAAQRNGSSGRLVP